MSAPLTFQDWIAIAARRLSRRWPRVPAGRLDEVAADRWSDEASPAVSPAASVARRLPPLSENVMHRRRA